MGADWEQWDALNGAELRSTSFYGTIVTCGVSVSSGQGSLVYTLKQLRSFELRSTASNGAKPQVTAVNCTGVGVRP